MSAVPANITVVTGDEIARSPAQSIPELLRNVPGVLVNDIAGNGRTYTVDLRGFGETASLNTLVLVDGRRINQADLSGVDWTLIPKDRVERIEIVRGGRGSVLYGDNASGGVINIITKKGTRELTGSGNLFVGSYETLQGNALASGSIKDLSIAVNANYRDSDGYRDNSDTLAKDAGLSLGYEVSDRLFLRFDGGYHKDDTSMPGGLYKSDLDNGLSRKATMSPDDYADTKDWYLQGGLQYYLTDDSYLDLGLSKRNRKAKFYYFSTYGNYAGDTEIKTEAFSPSWFYRSRCSVTARRFYWALITRRTKRTSATNLHTVSPHMTCAVRVMAILPTRKSLSPKPSPSLAGPEKIGRNSISSRMTKGLQIQKTSTRAFILWA